MTAHRCCPGCGAELTADGGTSCGCVGPFTAEHVDPMHIRPYVDLPEPFDPGPSTPDLEPFARCGTGETAELPALLPSGQHAEHPAEHEEHPGRDGAHEPSVSLRAGTGRRRAGRGGNRRGAPRVGDAPRRRRPGAVAMAAAGVVAALGAGLLTTQAFTDGDSGDDRSLSEKDRALPDVPSGGPTEAPSGSEKQKRDDKPSAAPSRTGNDPSRADRGGDDHTDREAVPTAAPSSEPGGSGSSNGDGEGNGDGGPGRFPNHPPRPPQESTQPGGPTLRPGDRGDEVSELQRRLKQAGTLDQEVPEDGVYSADVQRAVARYQVRNSVRGDRFGEYGPNTRRALESQTTG
ncbi:peptidoglycan-binding protein [Streptomyces ovatisporus]|uniref:Peptidoglycan-binding protein n=1 Tax=Streptomyces ovatisporus TaxID=1128682 RepID=A0ABV9A2Y7_9ACTN